MRLKKQIGQKLKALRIAQSLNQKTIAFELGISIALYSKIETGLSDISFTKTTQIAEFYGLSVFDVLRIGEDEINFPDPLQRLQEITEKYNEQQKKIIQLYEIIREYQKFAD